MSGQAPLISESVEVCIKILIVGSGSVGKSSLIRRLCRGQYDENYKKTIGVEYLETDITISSGDEDQEVKLMLWDTAGQEEFDGITRGYYKGRTRQTDRQIGG